MNRLTRKDTEFNGYTHEEAITSDLDLGECLTKLAAYEDTGLEPEKIQQLNDAFINSQKKLEKTFDGLFKYKDLEEQGLLMKLPCKPYTKVYEIYTKYDEKEDRYIKGIEESLLIRFGKNQYYEYLILKGECGEEPVTLEQFGKTVFLTREEAEKALEEKGE